jgi:hypothetical protein
MTIDLTESPSSPPKKVGKLDLLWNTIDGLSSLIRFATWGIVFTLITGGLLTALTIIADKRRDKLRNAEDLAKAQRMADSYALAAQANERAGVANQKAAELTVANSELQLQVEQEKLARLKIEQFFSPRTINERQSQLIREGLISFRGEKVVVFTVTGLTETGNFANALTKVLREGGLEVETRGGIIFGGNPRTGISFTVGDNRVSFANVLSHLFSVAGLGEPPFRGDKSNDANELIITIAPKN